MPNQPSAATVAGSLCGYPCERSLSEANETIALHDLASGPRDDIKAFDGRPSVSSDDRDSRLLDPSGSVGGSARRASRTPPDDLTELPGTVALANALGPRRSLDRARPCDARTGASRDAETPRRHSPPVRRRLLGTTEELRRVADMHNSPRSGPAGGVGSDVRRSPPRPDPELRGEPAPGAYSSSGR